MRNNPSENHSQGKVYDSRKGGIIHLPCFSDHRGSLCVAQSLSSLPFTAERIFWIYDVPSGRGRGGHAHRRQSQAIVAVSGNISVILDDGESTRTFRLSSPSEALVVPPGIWNILESFSPGAVCLVIASGPYDEDEYIRDYPDFLDFISSTR